jgi:hypothetical protein
MTICNLGATQNFLFGIQLRKMGNNNNNNNNNNVANLRTCESDISVTDEMREQL